MGNQTVDQTYLSNGVSMHYFGLFYLIHVNIWETNELHEHTTPIMIEAKFR